MGALHYDATPCRAGRPPPSASPGRPVARQLERDRRAAPGVRDSAQIRPPWASTIARAIARPSPVPPRSRARLSSTRWKRSKTRSSCSGGMPGPSSVTVSASRPSSRPATTATRSPGLGVGDGVAHQVAQHLGEPVRVGLEHPVDRLDVEVALAEQRQVAAHVLEEVGEVDRARLDQAAGLGAGQGEHVVDQPVHLVEPAQQRRACPRAVRVRRSRGRAARPGRAAPPAACAARAMRPRRSRAGARRRARAARASGRTLSASTPTSPRAATAPARSDRSPASTAAATGAMRRSGRAIRVAISTPAATASSSAERPDQREGAQQARLRVRRPASADRRPAACRSAALRGRSVARERRASARPPRPRRSASAVGRVQQPVRRAPHPPGSSSRSSCASTRARGCRGWLVTGSAAGHVDDEDARRRVIALGVDEAPRDALDVGSASTGRRRALSCSHSATWVAGPRRCGRAGGRRCPGRRPRSSAPRRPR